MASQLVKEEGLEGISIGVPGAVPGPVGSRAGGAQVVEVACGGKQHAPAFQEIHEWRSPPSQVAAVGFRNGLGNVYSPWTDAAGVLPG